MTSVPGLTTLSRVAHFSLVLLIICLVGVSGIFLLSQAVRTEPNKEWTHNGNAFVIGASYAIILFIAVSFQLKRKLAIRRKMQRISKVHRTLGKGDVPKAVHDFISEEFARACLIACESQPLKAQKEGMGISGSAWSGVNMRKVLIDTIPGIDSLTRLVIQHQPPLMPHVRMLHHFRTIVALFPRDEYGLTVVHYYDSAIQLARFSTSELTDDEFRMGMDAAAAITRLLCECQLEISDGTPTSSKFDSTSVES